MCVYVAVGQKNSTVAEMLSSGFVEYKGRYPGKYLKPVAFLFPLNILEEFSKPLSLSFRLFGNILADELTLSVL